MSEPIQIVPYNPDWPNQFEQEKIHLAQLFGHEAIAIEHVGSTSIPGQAAKPIIDIFVALSPFQSLADYKAILNPQIYHYKQTGINKRYLFTKISNGTWTHNIHLLPYTPEFQARNELLFRDYLRTHLELIREYGDLKKEAAKQSANMENYTRAKTQFIQKVVDAARAEKGLPPQNVWET